MEFHTSPIVEFHTSPIELVVCESFLTRFLDSLHHCISKDTVMTCTDFKVLKLGF
jgi:hypothetical protein